MASWNGSYFEVGSNENHNFVAPLFPTSNGPAFHGAAGDQLFRIPSEIRPTSTSNTLHFPTPAPPPVGTTTACFFQTNDHDQFSTMFVNNSTEMPGTVMPRSNSSDIAASSSLTPTAGEFVPRFHSVPPNSQNPGRMESKPKKRARGAKQMSNNSYSDMDGQFSRTAPHHESRFTHVSAPSRGSQEYSRGREWNGSYQGSFQRPHNLEDAKSQDRQRLLAEAAAFLTSPSTQDSRPVQQSEVNLVTATRVQSTHYKQRDSYPPQHSSERVFSNSKYGNNSLNPNAKPYSNYKDTSNRRRNFEAGQQQPEDGPVYQKSVVPAMSFSNSNGTWKGYQHRSTGVRDVAGTQTRNSPRREPTHHGNNDDGTSQRERLTEQLNKGGLECLVCCDRVRQYDPVWSCTNCFHVLHMKCIKKWATSSRAENGWRCPACQNVSSKMPQDYRCFCEKARDPEWNRHDTAHSCGEVCGKARVSKRGDCTHRCTLLCHPGPCPPCGVQVTRYCGCGKKSQVVKCGSDQPLLCGSPCEKKLNCGIHQCDKKCHAGDCGLCQEKVKQVCYCGKESRELPCDGFSEPDSRFSCGALCCGQLSCGHHSCQQQCHAGECTPCQLAPELVTHCHCGKTRLKEDQKRNSCLDPVPTCNLVCGHKLGCGQPSALHECPERCHEGVCPPCQSTTKVRCRCGHMDREIPCTELTTRADDARCEKKCTKKRACGKHKCNQPCCIELEHTCPLPCNRLLSCGQHRCEERCHRGHCQPCPRVSFDELPCECGAAVLFPPVACGTRKPECGRPCSRQHPCEHSPTHTCHSQAACPPCTVLTARHCHGGHELRKTVPCHQTEFSCGLPCGAPLSCGRHRCVLACHKGPCLREGQLCVQPCSTPRSLCGHPCAAPCHDGPCPDTACKETVKVTCECGHRSTTRTCADHAKDYQRIATSLLASKMADMQMGHSVDIGDLVASSSSRKLSLKTLDCNDECRIIERNRRMAIGLQIRNPDLSAKLTPRYSEFMRQWAKKDPHFCNMVHEKLSELVKLAKESKQKSRSYSFESMNRDKRHFVHEYCTHFGCESVAYDQEPKRNVVATAARDKAWLPSMSLLEVIRRENGQRKIPKPVISSAAPLTSRNMDVLPVKCSQPSTSRTTNNVASRSPPEDVVVDYFDYCVE